MSSEKRNLPASIHQRLLNKAHATGQAFNELIQSPHLYGYPPETVIAEKFQAMTALGMTNSRMKDFYNIWRLAGYFVFDGKILQNAIRRTFDNRLTKLPSETHVIFSDEFAVNKKAQWNSFSKKLRNESTIDMEQVVELMKKFFTPVLHASLQGIIFKKKWESGWR